MEIAFAFWAARSKRKLTFSFPFVRSFVCAFAILHAIQLALSNPNLYYLNLSIIFELFFRNSILCGMFYDENCAYFRSKSLSLIRIFTLQT